MLPDRVSNPGPLTYESGVLPIALRGPASGMVELGKDTMKHLAIWGKGLVCSRCGFGCFNIFSLVSPISLLYLPFFGRILHTD